MIDSPAKLKTKAELNSMNRDKLLKYATNLSVDYEKLFSKLFDETEGVIPQLQKQLKVATEINQHLLKKVNELERRQYSTDQYTRKESIELRGFDPNIPDGDVEKSVLEVLNAIKEDGEPQFTGVDIQACHKLKNNKLIICKFVSRKRMRAVISSRKKCKGKDFTRHRVPNKLAIFESMSPHYKNLNWRCMQLKKAEKIKDAWFFNGKFNVMTLESVKKTVIHLDDVCELVSMTEDELNLLCEQYKDVKFTAPRL
jgi:hypothetical protein